MSKVTLVNVGSLTQNPTSAQTLINENFSTIQTAFDNTLSRDGTTPNQLENTLDANSNQIINLPAPATGGSPARLQDLSTLNGGGTVTNIPVGGTTGQALVKTSNTNFATGWGSVVSSVGLSLPNDFSISNGTVTSSGVLTAGWTFPPTGTGAVVRTTSPNLTSPTITTGTPVGAGALGYSSNALTVGDGASAHVIVSQDQGQTLTNKTLTTPVISTATPTVSGELGFSSSQLNYGDGSVTHVVASLDQTQALTNKTINGNTITSGTGTLTLGSKTLTASNSLTLAGTDSTTMTFPSTSDTVMGLAATQTVSGVKTFGTNTLVGTAGAGSATFQPAGSISVLLTNGGTGADTTEDTLQTFTLPANTFDVVGRGIIIRAWGNFGADANNKTIRAYFGATAIYNSGAIAQNGTAWFFEGEVYKTGSNAQKYWANLIAANSDVSAVAGTTAATDTSTIVVKITGQNGTAVANDIVCQGMTIMMRN